MYRNLASYTKRDPASGKRQTYVWEATWDEDGNRIEIETPNQILLPFPIFLFK